MRKIDSIVVHCTDSPDTLDIGASVIRQWHTEPPRNWKDIGYHYVVRRSGEIECGRMESEIGAHTSGKNIGSIGVVWVGRDKPSGEQAKALERIVSELMERYHLGVHQVFGHREADPASGKTCPNINMVKFRTEIGQ